MKIQGLKAREILDSRSDPSVEVELQTNAGAVIASVPSGASVGSHEVVELRDNDPKRYGGLGVLKAIENIDKVISPAILNQQISTQSDLDKILNDLDDSEHKSKVGANAILAVSIAGAKALSQEKNIALFRFICEVCSNSQPKMPLGMFNFIEGAKHADNNLKIQEFLAIPEKPSFKENLRQASEHFHALKNLIKEKKLDTAVGHEGGFAPNLQNDEEAIKLILQAGRIRLGLDIAGNMPQGMTVEGLLSKYPIVSFEDPLGEEDWEGWANLLAKVQNRALIVGDDLLATNPQRLQMSIEKKAVNAVIVKPNQIGTVSEAAEFAKAARQARLRVIVSHRSGETEDTFISDFAIGVGADFVKFGAPSRGERVAKYNRLLRIEEQLNAL